MADPQSPVAFLGGHQRVTVDVECAHPDGGCTCARQAQVCAADDEDWPCERVRAHVAGRISGLRQAAALLAAAADRSPTMGRRELLSMYADECNLLAGAQEQRLFPPGSDALPPGIGVFGVAPATEPDLAAVAEHTRRVLRRRALRGQPWEEGFTG